MILHELFRVVSRFPRYISCYIAESVGWKCKEWTNVEEQWHMWFRFVGWGGGGSREKIRETTLPSGPFLYSPLEHGK